MKPLNEIVSHFGINANDNDIRHLGDGLINDTYKVTSVQAGDNSVYVLQRINHHIFKDVDKLQRNIEIVTRHIRCRLEAQGVKDPDRRSLRFLHTQDTGKTYHFDGEDYWRMMVFIDNTFTRKAVTPDNAYRTGTAFGEFQYMLSDITEVLDESIPDFHNMEFRLTQFRDAVNSDIAGRASGVSDIIGELEHRSEHACLAERLHREGKLPKRICHCDTKVDNILFDQEGNVVCVIDLDTVMPSFVFSDFGDFLRTAANTGKEDDPDTANVKFNMDVFRQFAKGYLESAGCFLTPLEIKLLPYAAERFAYMQAIRFLTDYLNGDTYYKTEYPEHNLIRTKAQFALLRSIESKIDEMTDHIHNLTHV
ncbi:phosphotransferase [uncultured Duncaniella sp.]|uniref:phosphotransferase enzyme family protein n=1 Tax=uncultured Duncaniella sp. TaxID=2768039 RepID=UPI0025A9AC45|nr:phosphotransferase [uncultured Duncaniella sp.]